MEAQVEEQQNEQGSEVEEQVKKPEVSPEVEERAKLYGWVPKEEFRGDPEKWTPANEYVRRADEMLPISKAMNRKLESDLVAAKGEITRLNSTMKKVIDTHKKIAERDYKGRLAEIKKQQVKAVSDGDTEAWQTLETEREGLEPPEEVEFEEKGGTEANPEVQRWKEENPWYDNDPEMGTYADSVSNFINARHPNLPAGEFLGRVREEVKKRFPEKFENPNRRSAPAPDSPSVRGGEADKGGKKTYSDLPKEAKEACDELVKQGVSTKEKYVQIYFEEA